MKEGIMDFTALSTYLMCPRKFYFKFERDWVSDGPASQHLVFGIAWHGGLERGYLSMQAGSSLAEVQVASCQGFMEYWEKNHGEDFDYDVIFPKNPPRGIDMLMEYWNRFYDSDKHWTVLGAEAAFTLDMQGTSLAFVGRRDLDIHDGHRLRTLEHKTMSMSSETAFAGYEQSLQIDGYLASARLFHDHGPEDQVPICILNGAICTKTKFDFQRYLISRNIASLERYLYEMSQHIQRLEADRKKLYDCRQEGISLASKDMPMPCFLRSPGDNCTKFFRKCEFYDHCTVRNNPETWIEPPIGYKESSWNPWAHVEEAG